MVAPGIEPIVHDQRTCDQAYFDRTRGRGESPQPERSKTRIGVV
jgi:hypothetical protein